MDVQIFLNKIIEKITYASFVKKKNKKKKMMNIENWVFLVGSISVLLWSIFKIPFYFCFIIATAIGIVISTSILGWKFSNSNHLKEKILNSTEDEIFLPDDFYFGAATASYQVQKTFFLNF